jgi:hypothetical protein
MGRVEFYPLWTGILLYEQLPQNNSIFAVICALLFLFYSSVFSICVRAHLDVDIQARNSEMLFVLVQFSCLGGRGIVLDSNPNFIWYLQHLCNPPQLSEVAGSKFDGNYL